MSEEIEKKILEYPKLPNVVQGDGRQLMSLLKAFLTQASEQINLANGFKAEEIKPDNSVKTPRNFVLTFNRFGATLTWDHIADIKDLMYYEIRGKDSDSIGESILDRTIENTSTKIPVTTAGTISLYTVNKQSVHSNPSKLIYSKPRPEAPQDISLIKNNEGTLITFLEIPNNCMGANIYIDGEKFSTFDNIFLFKHDENTKIERVEVAYYDPFGEGERGIVICVLPNITGFIVERNGPNLDFYWDSVNIYGVKYMVKVANEPDWNRAIDLFQTKLNKHRYIFPNTGQYCFLIKAVDEHNNFSSNASYTFLENAGDISKNVILDFYQQDTGYSGNKINIYYDVVSQGLKLEKDSNIGEYIAKIELPERYKARNWCEYRVVGVTNNDIYWTDMNFPWDGEIAEKTLWTGGVLGDINGTVIKQQLARFIGEKTGTIENIEFDNSLLTDDGDEPIENKRASDFRAGRWASGLFIGDLTKVSYNLPAMTARFSLFFWLKKFNNLKDCIILALHNGVSFLLLGYRRKSQSFYLVDSNGVEIIINIAIRERDWIAIGISQTDNKRDLFLYSLSNNKFASASVDIIPLATLNKLYLYPKIV